MSQFTPEKSFGIRQFSFYFIFCVAFSQRIEKNFWREVEKRKFLRVSSPQLGFSKKSFLSCFPIAVFFAFFLWHRPWKIFFGARDSIGCGRRPWLVAVTIGRGGEKSGRHKLCNAVGGRLIHAPKHTSIYAGCFPISRKWFPFCICVLTPSPAFPSVGALSNHKMGVQKSRL